MSERADTLTSLNISPGSLLAGRYVVRERVGSGGVGLVFKVSDSELNDELVALKLLHPHLSQDENQFKRFRNEVLVARALSHPNIVRLHDIGRIEGGFSYITMEYVEGYSLKERILPPAEGQPRPPHLPTKPLSFDEILETLYQVLSAVGYAHAKGIVHRDLKPANVLIGLHGEVKLADFGTARISGMDTSLTQTGQVLGTPDYMSPEQIRGDRLDASCDIYSLGIMAYELATGEKPFVAESSVAVAFKHLNEPIPPFAERFGFPLWYEEMVRCAAAKNKDERFSSVVEFARVLADGARGEFGDGSAGADGTMFARQTEGSSRGLEREFHLGDNIASASRTGASWKVGDSGSGRLAEQHPTGGSRSAKSARDEDVSGPLKLLVVLLALILLGGGAYYFDLAPGLFARFGVAPRGEVKLATDETQQARKVVQEELPSRERLESELLGDNTTQVKSSVSNSASVASVEVEKTKVEPQPLIEAPVTPQADISQPAISTAASTVEVKPSDNPQSVPVTTAVVSEAENTKIESDKVSAPESEKKEATPEPVSPVVVDPATISNEDIPTKFSLELVGGGRPSGVIPLPRLEKLRWIADVKNIPPGVAKDALARGYIVEVFKSGGQDPILKSTGELLSGKKESDAARIGGSLAKLSRIGSGAGDYRFVISRRNAKLSESSISVYELEEVNEPSVAVVTPVTVTPTPPPPPPTTDSLPLAAGYNEPAQPIQPQSVTQQPSVGSENYSGAIEFEDGTKRLALQLTVDGSQISGAGTVDSLGEFSVSGQIFPRGVELTLTSSTMGIRLSGSRIPGRSMRGQFNIPSQGRRGRWQVVGDRQL